MLFHRWRALLPLCRAAVYNTIPRRCCFHILLLFLHNPTAFAPSALLIVACQCTLPPPIQLIFSILGYLLRKLAPHSDLRTLFIEVVYGGRNEDGEDAQNRGGPFFGVLFADIGVHCNSC